MAVKRLDPRDMLEYNARYGVLICRECQYAIQKGALRSHLLRHKIYRGERERLLSSIAQLDLFEPHCVPLPTPNTPPIDGLPTIPGYLCTAAGCGNLCASSKRMRCHWSEIHGLSEPPPNSSSFARPVKLQTFFRGTKLKYFEVAPLPTVGAIRAVPLFTTDDKNENNERHGEQGHDADTATPLSPPSLLIPGPLPRSSPVDVDLEMLTYFYHFTTTTSLTLPIAEHPQPVTHYWQTDVVLLALQR